MYFDPIGSRIIAAGCEVNRVDLLDLDFNLLSTVLFPAGGCPAGITLYNSKIYVAIHDIAKVAVISNGINENIYPTVCLANLYRFFYFVYSIFCLFNFYY